MTDVEGLGEGCPRDRKHLLIVVILLQLASYGVRTGSSWRNQVIHMVEGAALGTSRSEYTT